MGILLEFLARFCSLALGCFRRSKIASDSLRRGVRSNQFRILCLKSFQLLQEHVELIIAHCRHILDVVPSGGIVENVSELIYPSICLCFFHKNN